MAYSEWKNAVGEIKFSTLRLGSVIHQDSSGYVRQMMSIPIDVSNYSLLSCDGITMSAPNWAVRIKDIDTSTILYNEYTGATKLAFTLDLSNISNIQIDIELTPTVPGHNVTMSNVVIS